MVKATVWILGTEYIGRGKDRNEALEVLNAKWQRKCDVDSNSDRRYLSKIAEHIRFVDE